MDEKVKEILGKQLELLAEVSEGKPENLADLSAAMCKIADKISEVRDPICNDRVLMSETIRDIFEGELKTSQTALGDELDRILGPEEFKALGQDLALVIAKHKLTRKPETCKKVFRYMSSTIRGWNSL